jgi:hypothetical protein
MPIQFLLLFWSQPLAYIWSFRIPDTAGESFELNATAAQEAGTLTKTAKPIILARGSAWKKLKNS